MERNTARREKKRAIEFASTIESPAYLWVWGEHNENNSSLIHIHTFIDRSSTFVQIIWTYIYISVFSVRVHANQWYCCCCRCCVCFYCCKSAHFVDSSRCKMNDLSEVCIYLYLFFSFHFFYSFQCRWFFVCLLLLLLLTVILLICSVAQTNTTTTAIKQWRRKRNQQH